MRRRRLRLRKKARELRLQRFRSSMRSSSTGSGATPDKVLAWHNHPNIVATYRIEQNALVSPAERHGAEVSKRELMPW